MTADTEPLVRLAHYIESRITALAMEYAEVCRLADISDETLGKIRKGRRARGSTYRKLERALQWQQDSIAAILSGGEPSPVETKGQPAAGASQGAPPLEQEVELAARLMAAQVRELGLSPDEAAEAWRRAQGRITQSHPTTDRPTPEALTEPPRHHHAG